MSNITYVQQIHAIDTVPQMDMLQNVAVSVKWELILRDGARTAGSFHITQLDAVSDPDKFVEFSQLTNQQVLDWINSKEDLQQHLDNLQSQLELQTDTVFEKEPPWGSESQNWLKNRFVLVHDDQVIWGPAKWNADQINTALFDHNVPVSVGRDRFAVLLENHAQLHDNTHMYLVKEGVANQPEVNYTFETVTENTWSFSAEHGAQLVSGSVVQKPLEEIKQDLIGMLKPIPTLLRSRGGFPLKLSETEIATISTNQLLILLCAQNFENSITIFDDNGHDHVLNSDQITQAIQHIVQSSQPDDHSEKIAAINQAENVEQLQSIYQGMVK